MATRKVALVGANEGAWVPTMDMATPELIVSIECDEAEILVYQSDKPDPTTEELEPAQCLRGKGTYAIPPAVWTRIAVKGNASGALCSIVSRRR